MNPENIGSVALHIGFACYTVLFWRIESTRTAGSAWGLTRTLLPTQSAGFRGRTLRFLVLLLQSIPLQNRISEIPIDWITGWRLILKLRTV